MKHTQTLVLAIAATGFLVGTSCAKKVATAPPPPPAAPAAVSTSRPVAHQPAAQPARAAVTPATERPKYPNAVTRARIDELLARIQDAYFDYNKASIRPDALKALNADATELRDILKDYPDYKLTIEGHCDERGSAEYNMALGDRRAEAARTFLVQVGIPASQFKVVSYGKEKPVCLEHDEACWQRNRRIHIVAMAQ